MKLQDKVAIITGVSGDGQVGQAVAQAFAKEGAKLVLVARRAEKVNARAERFCAACCDRGSVCTRTDCMSACKLRSMGS